jgi:lauroyl/myristoyl acyltransferase
MNQRIVAGQQADAQRAPSKRITMGDLAAMATLLSLGMVSWLVPVKWLGPISQAIGRGTALRHRGGASPTVKYVGGLRAAHDMPSAAPDIHKRYQDHRRETRLMVLALNRPWRNWRPIVRCNGLDHLQSSLERGLGTILWVSGFAYTEIITLMALQQVGIPIYQLVRPEHGFSASPFGIRWLNPIWTRIEQRLNAEQIVILNNDAGVALRLIRERLGANGIVWISVGPEAKRMLHIPFIKGTISLPTAPLHLARTSHAALLPVFTIRANDGTYDVTIERPLDVDSDITYENAARSYAAMLEQYVTAHPAQWRAWESLIVAPALGDND